MISTSWKKMNKERIATSPYSETFIEIVIFFFLLDWNCIQPWKDGPMHVQYRDGQGVGNYETKDCLSSLFVHSIPLYRDQHDEIFIYRDVNLKLLNCITYMTSSFCELVCFIWSFYFLISVKTTFTCLTVHFVY